MQGRPEGESELGCWPRREASLNENQASKFLANCRREASNKQFKISITGSETKEREREREVEAVQRTKTNVKTLP